MTELENNREKFHLLRKTYPVFNYEYFRYEFLADKSVSVEFCFTCKDIEFRPTLSFNSFHLSKDTHLSKQQIDVLVFNMGMVELISYWKAFASPMVNIKCGKLSDKQVEFFKKLYWNGLGEYFYLNGLVGYGKEEDLVNIDTFLQIESSGEEYKKQQYNLEEEFIVPIGGGKDSVVSVELLRGIGKRITPLVINSRKATKDCLKVAKLNQALEIKRVIDKNLLELNKQGFLNGHTPFSAMLAFTSLFSSALCGKKHIALSNEDSANESTVVELKINHQYSKSLEFENDFRAYYKEFIGEEFDYFSLLRPISELRIAEIFSQLPYLQVFKSCNVGSKEDIWCGHCPKCLFAFIILSPFIEPEKLEQAFSKNLFADDSLLKSLKELDGEYEVKPFECVGTVNEVNVALSMRVKNFAVKEEDKLLSYWQNSKIGKQYIGKDFSSLLESENSANNLPMDLKDIFKNRYSIIKKAELSRELSDKRIGIMGLGREGISTYKLLSKILPNANFVLFDQNKDINLQNFDVDNYNKVVFSEKSDYKKINSLCDIIFLTPGIAIKDLEDIDLNKISNQCDIFLSLFKQQTIGISGTKGKSTTSTLVYQMIKEQNENVLLAGNIGVPVFDIIDKINKDTVIVLELSCHQLHNIKTSPKVSVLLNIFQEHLDHYTSYEDYQLAKLNLLTKGEEDDIFIYNKESEIINHWVEHFNLKRQYKNFAINEYSFSTPLYLKGEHNKGNILAALLAVTSFGYDTTRALDVAIHFHGLNHRLQFVARKNDVDYYNDSISTIPQATLQAMKALQNVSVLILGGMDRGIDYSEIIKVLDYGVKHIAFVGKAGKRMYDILIERKKDLDYILSDDWEYIIEWAEKKAEKNTCVLLSPAASSYDQFKNFEYRGRKFEELVLKQNNNSI
ncbi:MAG: UDP-N-acetylmuramoyl-L-alanine--D-glutamate ligase [Bacteroidales bacterium]|nr:UDP-N-acetylmuramoyl-L-alanine--D-glutamate ligase [Bacteroidales bacterium]